MLFFQEPQKAFSLLSVLQMGQDHRLNRDGYVYVYGANGITEGTMNELVLFRVPKGRVRDQRMSNTSQDGSRMGRRYKRRALKVASPYTPFRAGG